MGSTPASRIAETTGSTISTSITFIITSPRYLRPGLTSHHAPHDHHFHKTSTGVRTMIRVAIISFEHMHAFSYANAFHSLAETELVAAADADAERRERVKKDFAFIPQLFADYREMLDK